MPTHFTKPFDTSGKSAARRHHRSACDLWDPCQTHRNRRQSNFTRKRKLLEKQASHISHDVELPAVTCYASPMATTPKKSKPRTPKQRMASRRGRLRAQGLRPGQHLVPDLRDPKVLAEIPP